LALLLSLFHAVGLRCHLFRGSTKLACPKVRIVSLKKRTDFGQAKNVTEQLNPRFDLQFFNVFNHPNFGLPSMVLAGLPENPATQIGLERLLTRPLRRLAYSASVWAVTARPA
jgi:hypothetical protein